MYFIGIDNGCTGSIGIINSDTNEMVFKPTPNKKVLDFQTTSKKYVTRVDFDELCTVLMTCCLDETKVMVEIPLMNPHLWKASISAVRALETTWIALEKSDLSFEFISVHKWRKRFIPGYTSTMKAAEAKKLGMEIAIRKFPALADEFRKHGDPDGLLIAEHCKLTHFGEKPEPKKELDPTLNLI